MDKCIFCKIAQGEIPSTKVYEDEKFFAFLDINPESDGHTLLIPKDHYVWMQDAPDELVGEIFITAKKLMQKLIDEKKCEFVRVKVIGKDVPHFHIHLVPEYSK
ncbi:MAG: HIT domain-containing protein [Candidatus Moranbacteria bacterium]|nr:HIT domain-containing protein [Candidatus Moranbacteria bacterium]